MSLATESTSVSWSAEKNNFVNYRANTNGYEDRYEQDDSDEYVELQYKKPKKMFRTKEEQLEFVRSYTAKKKTEVI